MKWLCNLFNKGESIYPDRPPQRPDEMSFKATIKGNVILTEEQVEGIVDRRIKCETSKLHDRITKLQRACKSLTNEQVKNLIRQETNELKLRIEELERINRSQIK